MHFGNYYYTTIPRDQKAAFRKAILERTGVHYQTLYDWINGTTTPNKPTQEILIDELNKLLPPDKSVTPADVQFGAYQQV